MGVPFNFRQYLGGTKSRSLTSSCRLVVVSDAVGLEDITSDIPVTVPGAIGAGPDLEANLTGPDLETNLTFDIRPPQPSYDPQSHAERSRANARAQHQGMEVSDPPTATHAIQEQDVGVRGGDAHTE